MVDPDRLSAAYETARCDLLAESATAGHWIGELSSSAFSTATAISALALVERHAPTIGGHFVDEKRECRLSELIMASVRWLARHQNADGGWGDTDKSVSNIATTMLVRAAFALTAVPADCPGILERADEYIAEHGGMRGLRRRYGKDKSFAAPILTNCALAGLISWRKVPALRFEIASLPQKFWKHLRLPVVGCAIPTLIAVGQARYFHRKPRNPVTRLLRGASIEKSLQVLEQMQPASGGFLEAIPLTSFVVMSLASIGRVNHAVVRQGVEFLLASVRPDGSWPIGSNLANWNTTSAVNALAAAGEDVRELGCLDWVLSCQHGQSQSDRDAEPGGWAWTAGAGGLPGVDDTSSALRALAAWSKCELPAQQQTKILAAAALGVNWLLEMQNVDGGWPTFCRGSGKLQCDRSGSDLTAHALRAMHAWHTSLVNDAALDFENRRDLDERICVALDRGLQYLLAAQRPDGSWVSLWFGDQHRQGEENPVYGTAKVIAAFRDLGRLDCEPVRRALEWLLAMKHADGSWGSEVAAELTTPASHGCVEETALATEALFVCGQTPAHEIAAAQGLTWLIDAVEANRHHECSPIGVYFGKLWYYEKLYPLTMTASALGQAARRLLPQPESPSVVHAAKR